MFESDAMTSYSVQTPNPNSQANLKLENLEREPFGFQHHRNHNEHQLKRAVWNSVPSGAWNLLRYLGFGDWGLGFSALGSLTAKIITRPSIPRTSCGGNSSKLNESPARSCTAAVTSNGLPTVFVRSCMREAMFTVFPIAVNSSRCGEPTLPTMAGPE